MFFSTGRYVRLLDTRTALFFAYFCFNLLHYLGKKIIVIERVALHHLSVGKLVVSLASVEKRGEIQELCAAQIACLIHE